MENSKRTTENAIHTKVGTMKEYPNTVMLDLGNPGNQKETINDITFWLAEQGCHYGIGWALQRAPASSRVRFSFVNAELATAFALKWS